MSATALPRTAWRENGFSAPPVEKESNGTELVYRAVGGQSVKLWSNCFFAPVIDGSPLVYWTAELLERELNAALWGNDFERVFCFQMRPRVHYEIGPIAHDDYVGKAGRGQFYQRSWVTSSGVFQQVRFRDFDVSDSARLVVTRGSSLVKAGRYARVQGRRRALWS